MAIAVALLNWPVGELGNDLTPRALNIEEHPGSAAPLVRVAYIALSVLAFALADDAEDLAAESLDAAQELADRVCAVEETKANKWLASQAQHTSLLGLLLGAGASPLSCAGTQLIINGCMTALRGCLIAGSRRMGDRYGLVLTDVCDRAIEHEAISSANDGIQQMIRHNDWRSFKLSAFSAEQSARAHGSALRQSSTSNSSNLLNLAIGNYNGIYQVATGAVNSFVDIGSAALGAAAGDFQAGR